MLISRTSAILAISITAFSGFIFVQYVHLPSPAFNDSIHRGQPTIEFQRGDTVNILVCNLDTIQSHGFAIDHYFPIGVTLRPGEAYKVSFVAKEPGSFTIYCNVFCTVHTFMKGRLVVN